MLVKLVKFFLEIIIKTNRQKVKDSFKRVLPVGDYFSDRWEKARFYGFGEGTSVYDNVLIFGDVNVGKNCWIGPNCILDGSGGKLSIGDNCSVSAGVHIYTHDTVQKVLTAGIAKGSTESVSIGNDCYIGPNSVISKGSIIGKKCVIGALTFVNGKTVPSFSSFYANRGKIIINDKS